MHSVLDLMPNLRALCSISWDSSKFPFTWDGLLASVRWKEIAPCTLFCCKLCLCLHTSSLSALEAPVRPRAVTSRGPALIWEGLWLHPKGEVGSHPRVERCPLMPYSCGPIPLGVGRAMPTNPPWDESLGAGRAARSLPALHPLLRAWLGQICCVSQVNKKSMHLCLGKWS